MLGNCFPGIVYCPSGEVDMQNLAAWQAMPNIVAPMGAAFLPQEHLEQQDRDAVRERLRGIAAICRGAG